MYSLRAMTRTGAWAVHVRDGLRAPAFVLDVDDARAEERRLAPHFVSLFVATDDDDEPYLQVVAPDIAHPIGVFGPFDPAEQRELEDAQRGAATCTVAVRDASHAFELTRFANGIVLDFTGDLGRAVRLARAGRTEDAVGRLLALRERELPPTGVSYELGRARVSQGAWEEALELFDEEIAQHTDTRGRVAPFASFPWLGKAATLRRMSRFDDARRAYDTALRLRPNYVEALCGLSTLLAQRPGNDTRSVRWGLARAMKCQPESQAVRDAVHAVAPALGVAEPELVRRLQLLGPKVDLGALSV